MVKRNRPQVATKPPTDAELNILNALWKLGPSTVREVHDLLRQTHQLGYTTALKLLQIMLGKGLVVRDDSERAHVYRPTLSKEDSQQELAQDLIRRAFDGSPSQLVLQALGGSAAASPAELRTIREFLDRLEADGVTGDA
jgi:BlaI family transcriptional regulator, penicillinase repressor